MKQIILDLRSYGDLSQPKTITKDEFAKLEKTLRNAVYPLKVKFIHNGNEENYEFLTLHHVDQFYFNDDLSSLYGDFVCELTLSANASNIGYYDTYIGIFIGYNDGTIEPFITWLER